MRGKINQVNLTREPQHKNGKYCFHLCYIRVYNFITHLTSHRFRVDLAHVSTGIIFLNVRYVQFPRVMSIMRNRESWIMCY